ncbi:MULTISPECIES: transglutaminase-like cysteine peptidase [unclassified Bradyrhizobium]|uniref:transglutaminase-like cysteine peptidase n=1 Tax=unclassified Bradyrhizobium TaxID=2631580 RepID=UPI00247AEBFC|nr:MULTISPECIES: transglutaminase-like cysteine peptidase [unclassified Bradyrhizobium]WGS21515.1 transglutaminase-like cysteine peptidase [Bradyrhizobium sp. ISRA463]WGS28452.1 transglutaminase-like cysteine peptidase [Bradyrhizobium sp. ISRA464]
MTDSLQSRALRGVMLVCSLVWLTPAAELNAASLLTPGPAELIGKSTEPFGLPTTLLANGGLHRKWLGVQRQLADELVQLAHCDGDREGCGSPEALRFLAIIDAGRARDGRARLGTINRAVNLAIRPGSDLALYGEIDVWTSPLATFAKGAGDCEDYAIAKFVALREAGVAPDDLRIVIMHDLLGGEDHAVVAARLDGRWLTLDNRRMAMIKDSDVRNFRPTFVIDQHGVSKYIDAPPVMEAALRPAHVN